MKKISYQKLQNYDKLAKVNVICMNTFLLGLNDYSIEFFNSVNDLCF